MLLAPLSAQRSQNNAAYRFTRQNRTTMTKFYTVRLVHTQTLYSNKCNGPAEYGANGLFSLAFRLTIAVECAKCKYQNWRAISLFTLTKETKLSFYGHIDYYLLTLSFFCWAQTLAVVMHNMHLINISTVRRKTKTICMEKFFFFLRFVWPQLLQTIEMWNTACDEAVCRTCCVCDRFSFIIRGSHLLRYSCHYILRVVNFFRSLRSSSVCVESRATQKRHE